MELPRHLNSARLPYPKCRFPRYLPLPKQKPKKLKHNVTLPPCQTVRGQKRWGIEERDKKKVERRKRRKMKGLKHDH